jgi:hypothetical protein
VTERNPKQEGTVIYDCIPQSGKCPIGCNQCFFNREGAFYTEVPSVPTPEEVGDGIVRMNTGNDSNVQRSLVVKTARKYKDFFFNTSTPKLDFPGPVVFTANGLEEECPHLVMDPPPNLMFVRLRVSGTNLFHIDRGVSYYTAHHCPVVLTFMSYYSYKPKVSTIVAETLGVKPDECYTWKTRHINSYYCPTGTFMDAIMRRYATNRLVSMCGSIHVPYCRACRNCETYYIQTMKRMRVE